MTRKTCNKCRSWKRASGVGSGMCVRFLRVMGAGDTCDQWEARK